MSTEPEVYAVIRSGGKQYRVSPGSRVTLERLDGDAGDEITFDDVLLVNGGGDITVGTPTVESASVTGEIIEQGRGRKVNVFKYKSKTRYRRLRGHRQLQTSVLVSQVALGDQLWAAETDEQSEPDDAPSTDEPTAESEDAPTAESPGEEIEAPVSAEESDSTEDTDIDTDTEE